MRKEKTYKALVREKGTGKKKIIKSKYFTKYDFIRDLRANGYMVNEEKVKEAKEFDYIMNHTNAAPWDWNRRKWGL